MANQDQGQLANLTLLYYYEKKGCWLTPVNEYDRRASMQESLSPPSQRRYISQMGRIGLCSHDLHLENYFMEVMSLIRHLNDFQRSSHKMHFTEVSPIHFCGTYFDGMVIN